MTTKVIKPITNTNLAIITISRITNTTNKKYKTNDAYIYYKSNYLKTVPQ